METPPPQTSTSESRPRTNRRRARPKPKTITIRIPYRFDGVYAGAYCCDRIDARLVAASGQREVARAVQDGIEALSGRCRNGADMVKWILGEIQNQIAKNGSPPNEQEQQQP